MSKFLRSVLLLLSCSLYILPLYANSLIGTVIHIHDGDTLQVLSNKKTYKIRLLAIDAPEQDQAYGNEAKKNLSRLTLGKSVTVHWQKRDAYQRIIGQVFVQHPDCKSTDCKISLDINHQQVHNGAAWWYRHYANEQSAADAAGYEQAENQARQRRIGLWAQPNPAPPWSWRRSHSR
jgi:endonuclease YncB( thermonuclease family)